MDKYEEAKEYVYSQYQKIYNPVIHQEAFVHTASVDNFATLLAISRGVDIQQAKIAALFHDYAKFVDNCPSKDHARLSSLYAHKYLTGTKRFSIADIDEICFAINAHSRKDQVDSELAEVLKDADVMARFVENPMEHFPAAKQKRILKACADLQP